MDPHDFYSECYTTVIVLTYRNSRGTVSNAIFSDRDDMVSWASHHKVTILGHSISRLYYITSLPLDPKSLSPTLPLCDD